MLLSMDKPVQDCEDSHYCNDGAGIIWSKLASCGSLGAADLLMLL
jgi:hypothetical protein